MSAAAFLLQMLLLASRLSELAGRMPSGGAFLAEALPGLLLGVVVTSFVFLLPAIFLLGISATFRIAGPVYRMESHLRRVAAGERPGPCRIRKHDELQELCRLMNAAMDSLRTEHADDHRASEDRAA